MSRYYSPSYLKDIQTLCVTENFRNTKTAELVPVTSLINQYTSYCILLGESFSKKYANFNDWLKTQLVQNGGNLERAA